MIFDRTADSESSCAGMNKAVVHTTIIKQALSLIVGPPEAAYGYAVYGNWFFFHAGNCCRPRDILGRGRPILRGTPRAFLGVLCDLGGRWLLSRLLHGRILFLEVVQNGFRLGACNYRRKRR